MKQKELKEPERCLHLSWRGEGGWMVCRQCGAVRMPKPWEDAGSGSTADVDALRIRHDGLDGDV